MKVVDWIQSNVLTILMGTILGIVVANLSWAATSSSTSNPLINWVAAVVNFLLIFWLITDFEHAGSWALAAYFSLIPAGIGYVIADAADWSNTVSSVVAIVVWFVIAAFIKIANR